jgi:hypothetical protein
MRINLSYNDFRNTVNSKSLLWQFKETTKKYEPFALDNTVIYQCEIWKSGYEPKGVDVAQNTADRTDFETNYKAGGNKKLEEAVKFLIPPVVGSTKPNIGARAWVFSHNFCDKTTWYGDSIRITDEAVGIGNGSLAIFTLDNQNVIDLSHGRVSDEDYIVETYRPVVKIDGVTKTETEFGESAADYSIDYANGSITFTTPPINGAVITASYSYSPPNAGSTLYVRPEPGKKLVITVSEAQLFQDFAMTDNLISALFTYNPALGAPPAKFEYPGTRSRYKRLYDFINYTLGSFPVIPAFSTGERALTQDVIHLRYDYQSVITLDDAYGAELRIWMEHHRPFTGTAATITFYGYQE